MIEVFKTNVVKPEDAKHILFILNRVFPEYYINFDLEDCDHILRVEHTNILVLSETG
jgi:hypothetical protein